MIVRGKACLAWPGMGLIKWNPYAPPARENDNSKPGCVDTHLNEQGVFL